MEYRKFGPTDITVSAIGFGCWEVSRVYTEEMAAAIPLAVDRGITCFDTAAVYGDGESERMLGKALGSRRKDVVVVTKCGAGYANRPPKGRDGRREAIFSSVEESLQNLQSDYVDVLMPHWPDTETPFEETMLAMDELVQQGKVRAVGLSNFSMEQLKACEAARRVDVLQHSYNMFDRRPETAIYPYCEQQGIGVMAWGSLANGILGGRFTADTQLPDGDWRGNAIPEYGAGMYADIPGAVRLVDDLKPIGAQRGKTMAQLALRWVMSNPAVSVALVGITDSRELEENLGALDWALSGEELREVDEVFARYGVDTRPDLPFEP